MKTLTILLALLLLPVGFSRADSFLLDGSTIANEAITADASWEGGWTTADVTNLTWDLDSICFPGYGSNNDPTYFHHLDSHLVRVRIECDPGFVRVTKIRPSEDEDFEPYYQYQLEGVVCDTFYRWEYDSVMAQMVPVWLDSAQHDKLTEWLNGEE